MTEYTVTRKCMGWGCSLEKTCALFNAMPAAHTIYTTPTLKGEHCPDYEQSAAQPWGRGADGEAD